MGRGLKLSDGSTVGSLLVLLAYGQDDCIVGSLLVLLAYGQDDCIVVTLYTHGGINADSYWGKCF